MQNRYNFVLLALFLFLNWVHCHNRNVIAAIRISEANPVLFGDSSKLQNWAFHLNNSSRSLQNALILNQNLLLQRSVLLIRGGNANSWTRASSAVTLKSAKRATERLSSHTSSTTLSSPNNKEEDDEEISTKEVIDAFLTRESRNTFISRVYAIFAAQLLVTAISVYGFSGKRDLAIWFFTKGKPFVYVSMIFSMSLCTKMSVSVDARRKSPTKWYLLSLFTASEAFLVGLITAMYSSDTVLNAFLVTAAATLGISIYTIRQKNPKYDLSQWGAGLSSCCFVLLIMGLLRIFFNIPISNALYSAGGSILFSFYLAHHTRLIVSGKNNKYQMNEKDYILGAMTLYMDVINIFLKLLELFADKQQTRK